MGAIAVSVFVSAVAIAAVIYFNRQDKLEEKNARARGAGNKH